MREGESVNFVGGGKTVHGTLHIFHDGSAYHVYWQPDGSAEQYTFATAGDNRIRLISTPPQGVPVSSGPGTLPPQQVLSCPAF